MFILLSLFLGRSLSISSMTCFKVKQNLVLASISNCPIDYPDHDEIPWSNESSDFENLTDGSEDFFSNTFFSSFDFTIKDNLLLPGHRFLSSGFKNIFAPPPEV